VQEPAGGTKLRSFFWLNWAASKRLSAWAETPTSSTRRSPLTRLKTTIYFAQLPEKAFQPFVPPAGLYSSPS
jgi:hypothetical protein